MIITIDGPAGAGKSTASRTLARHLGFQFLDTGAMYRAVSYLALRSRLQLHDEDALANLVEHLQLEMPPGQVLVNNEDVTSFLRTPEITAASGIVADSPSVRKRLVLWQRMIALGGDFVCEGRDQGTIVFPNARCKFFLHADPIERARRRHRELQSRGQKLSLEEVLQAQDQRDQRDARRDIAPMIPAPDAIILDSTQLSIEEVVAIMEAEVKIRKLQES